jgi:hypothetical protein
MIDACVETMLEPGSDFSKLLQFMYGSKDACKNGNTASVCVCVCVCVCYSIHSSTLHRTGNWEACLDHEFTILRKRNPRNRMKEATCGGGVNKHTTSISYAETGKSPQDLYRAHVERVVEYKYVVMHGETAQAMKPPLEFFVYHTHKFVRECIEKGMMEEAPPQVRLWTLLDYFVYR